MSLVDGLREITADEADAAFDEVLGNLEGEVGLASAQGELVFNYDLFLQIILRLSSLTQLDVESDQVFTRRDRVMMAFGALITGATTALAAETKEQEGGQE